MLVEKVRQILVNTERNKSALAPAEHDICSRVNLVCVRDFLCIEN